MKQFFKFIVGGLICGVIGGLLYTLLSLFKRG